MSRKRRFKGMMVNVVSLVAGLLLGWRFKVMALIPAILMVLILVLATGGARNPVWWTVVLGTAAVTSLQIGYLAGVCLLHILAAARSSRSTATPYARPTVR
jgi:hypothetical protein